MQPSGFCRSPHWAYDNSIMRCCSARLAARRLIPILGFWLLIMLAGLPAARADDGAAPQLEQDTILPVEVGYIVEQGEIAVQGRQQTYQRMEVIVSSGSRRGEVITLETGRYPTARQQLYREGDRLYITESYDASGRAVHLIVGRDRRRALMALAVVFCCLVVGAARGVGLRALLGMAISFAIIFVLVLPRMSQGHDPVRSALLGLALAMPFSFYLAHGLNRKTTVALLASLMGLLLTWGLSQVAVQLVHLTGLASDEAGFLSSLRPVAVDVKRLLLAGMLISVMGVLDDVTVAQAAVVEQIQAVAPHLGWRQLFGRATRVGQDHIASMVNTLVLVYTGAALPLLLLLADRSLPLGYILSHEVVAEEIVKMLVTSAGLLMAVPIATLLAAVVAGWRGLRANRQALRSDQ